MAEYQLNKVNPNEMSNLSSNFERPTDPYDLMALKEATRYVKRLKERATKPAVDKNGIVHYTVDLKNPKSAAENYVAAMSNPNAILHLQS